MLVILGVMFVMSTQPMMIMSSMILCVMFYSMYLLWEFDSFWYSYMLVLVLMSGVLVVFTYMMSVLPNESFEISSLFLVIMGLVMFMKYPKLNELVLGVSIESMKMWSGKSIIVSMFLVTYLLVIMVMVVWLSMLEKGAVRIN